MEFLDQVIEDDKVYLRDEPEFWLDEWNLNLLEGWARDGLTYRDIAKNIGIPLKRLTTWRKQFPEIERALNKGREVVDYMVESALLKSALGFQKKETKVITTIRHGKTVEVVKETTTIEVDPKVSAIQTWLFNRVPDKWTRDPGQKDNPLEETGIHIEISRADRDDSDMEGVNTSVKVRKATKAEKEAAERRKKEEAREAKKQNQSGKTKVEVIEEDLDAWPDDWEEE